MSKRLFYIFFIIVAVATISARVMAQDNRVQVAQAYEQSGDYRSAARLWQTLYQESPANDSYFQGVVRSFKALANYSGMIDIIQDKLKRKRTPSLLSTYALALFKSGRIAEADEAWSEAIAGAASAATIKEIASSQIEAQSVDRAIATLVGVRKKFELEALFADELSKLYASQGNYRLGIHEVLLAFTAEPNLQAAEGRLSAFMVNDTAIVYLREKMKDVVEQHEDDYPFLRLYEWFLRETKHYDEALAIVIRIDKLLVAKGRELLNFAEQARMDGQYEVASRAYSSILKMARKSDVAPFASFGYAACIEAQINDAQTLSREQWDNVISLYRELASNYRGSTTAADALLHVARIESQVLNEPQAAVKDYQEVIQSFSQFPQASLAAVELGSVYLQSDSISLAMRTYQRAIGVAARSPQTVAMAQFNIAELLFFTGQLDSALQIYKLMSDDAESEFANDAIERMTTISLNRSDTALLDTYARAAMRQTQRQFDDALAAYKQVYTQRSNPDLAELAAFRAAEVCFQLKKFQSCRDLLNTLAVMNPETLYGDRAMMLSGNSFLAEGNKAEALRTFESLLSTFPRSQLVQDAREKIRKLRANS